MGRLDNKIAFVTGAARGQGREHCVRMAEEGADIIAVDICGPVSDDNQFPPATAEDLAETVRLVEALGRRIVARQGDVRDLDGLRALCSDGATELGGIDIVVANAGVSNWNRFWEMPEQQWQDMIDINLTGVWKTLSAAVPIMVEQGRGGSIIITSSVAGLKSLPAQAHYSAAKHGLVGLCKSAAIELGPYNIRVNTIHPWGVATPMAEDHRIFALMEQHPTYAASFAAILAEPMIASARQIADVVLFLASDEARVITGAQIPADMGATKV
ncbi:MAG: mycofactocin-coupled SDR family oxidoreductase [Acidimicrobiia bacterium]